MGNNKLLVKNLLTNPFPLVIISAVKEREVFCVNCSQCEEDKQIAIRQKRRDGFGFPSVSLP